MNIISDADLRLQFVEPMLRDRGWDASSILIEPVLRNKGKIVRPDYVLSIDAYPVAIVEAKTNVKNIEDAIKQVESYRLSIKVLTAFLIINKKIYEINSETNSLVEINEFPTMDSLAKKVSTISHQSKLPVIHNLHQMQAISSVLNSVSEGSKRISLMLTQGSGASITKLKIITKLLASKPKAKILVVFDRKTLVEHFVSLCKEIDLQPSTLKNQDDNINNSISIVNFTDFKFSVENFGYDFVFFDNIHSSNFKTDLFSENVDSTLIYLSSTPDKTVTKIFGEPVYSYSLTNIIQDEVITPPNGFETVKLGEIANLTFGRYHKKIEEDGTNKVVAKVIKASDLSPVFSLERLHESDVYEGEKGLVEVKSGDILLTRMFHSQPSLTFLENCDNTLVLLPQSIVHIRVIDTSILPSDVYNFLNSDTGKRALLQYTNIGSTTQKSFSIKQLQEIGVFIPQPGTVANVGIQLSTARKTIIEIKDKILPLLEDVERSYSSPEGLETSQLELAGRRLDELASILVPKTLEERILTLYPMPIAIPFQRFLNARFNVFEQVMRLKDVYESICFFVYNVLLADSCRRLDVAKYYVDNKKSRMAFNDFSMADRLSFIEDIQNSSRLNSSSDLFIPELLDGFSVADARKLKDDLRNQAAHTATAPENQQKRVLERFLPVVENMLEKLSFLEKYQMVRIPSFYYDNSDLVRRMEVYAGTYPLIDEQVLAEGIELTPADREHLVLLDQEDNVLDLYPIYQLVSNETTRFESHVCFLKQRMGGSRNKLEGESVQGALTLEMDGIHEFDQIRTNLQNRT